MKSTFPWVSLLLACGLGLTSVAQAQAFPQRPIRIVVPFAAGGSTDAMARLVGQKMAESLGQTVLVDNRPGAGGAIASDQVAKAPADGHTLLMATTSTHAILPVANPRLPYDAQKDFAPIGMVAQAPNVLIVSPTLNVHDVAGLIAWAKARPQALSFASSGNGTITHLVAEAFNKAAGIRALTDVSSGAIAYQFDSITWTLPQAKAGKVRALAITSAKRSPLAPDLPTVAESGLPGFEGLTWFGFVAPAATPVEIQQRLTQALSLALQHPETQQKLIALGAEPASGQASELQHWMKQDAARWGQVIKEAGVKFE
jgi:tripartite-type tricarboxylate transporter receptor subunit TctC